ncbi:hypothetical protein ACOMHN_059693 [Nucella lapillus]
MIPHTFLLLSLCLGWQIPFSLQQNDVNVALNKNYSQVSKYWTQGPSSNGANGDTSGTFGQGNCIHSTVPYDNPWWQVDLGRTYPVSRIDIWARNYFKERLYPSTITVDQQTCGSITSFPYLNRKREVTCSSVKYGQTVRITRQGSDKPLNMCEMQIWVPRDVSQCAAGRYGSACSSDCSITCGKGPGKNFCSQSSAYCYDGCVDGWYGDQCSTPCSPGCRNTVCDRQSAQCYCQTGYRGKACTGCVAGWYGAMCTLSCQTAHCQQCDQDTGALCSQCTFNSFLLPPQCTDCPEGYYKRADNSGCNVCTSNCKSGTVCDKTTGHCPLCPAGKQGHVCDRDCDLGRYGQNCTADCGHCRSQTYPGYCRPDTGECVYGCLAGWQTSLCNKECEDGRYGARCTQTCGQCKGAAVCKKTDGHCSNCQPGWKLPTCNTECPSGYYGAGCNQTCGQCRNNSECRHDTGVCTGQCAGGFTGLYCAQAITDDGSDTGTIAGAAVAAVVVLVIAVLIVVIVLRRRRKQAAKSSALVAESSEMSNNSHNEADPERSGTTSLSFDPIVSKAGKPDTRPKAQIRPVVKATVQTRTDQADGHVYENVTLPKQDSSSSTKAASPRQAGKINRTAHALKGGSPAKTPAQPVTQTASPGPVNGEEGEETLWPGGEPLYSNDPSCARFEPPIIPLHQLHSAIVESLKNHTLTEDFGHMQGLKEYPMTQGQRQENYYKNRFNSILPYDKHRVVLEQVDGDEASDYMNASFIEGYKTEKAYIASQGPKPNTQDDFWRMVWQERITDIVMLTNVKEGIKPKCHEYWPAQGSTLSTGHVEVTGVEEEERAHYVIRLFNIRKLQSPEQRQVRQYHYVKWMDHEVPATTPLVEFWRYVRARAPRTATAPPLLVHCSAGVGRTGTYIALDILIDQSQQQQDISLYSTVDNLRNYRCHMVQNKGQYEFLHEAVLEAYMSGDSRLKTSSFDSTFPAPIRHDQPHPRIDAQYQKLCQMKTDLIQPSHTTASLEENRQKNRNPQSLPDDKHLVYITEHTEGRTQYINAVYMPTFLSSRGSIVTQLPLVDTVIDFWRMVDSWDVSTIVSIGPVDTPQDTGYYWPRHKADPVTCGAYTVTFMSMTSLGDTLNSYTVNMKKEGKRHDLRVLHYEAWTGEVADNVPDLLNLLDTLHTEHKQSTDEPIIIQCIDGAAKSGALCALWDVISRVTCDDDVDVYLAVRHVHTVRPEAISSLVQYRFIYEVVQHYRNSISIYANT